MLQQVLREFEHAREPLNLRDLAHKLGVERSALEGMIDYWIRKGRLKDDSAQTVCSSCGSGSACGSEPQGCPFVGKMPRTISLVTPDEAPVSR